MVEINDVQVRFEQVEFQDSKGYLQTYPHIISGTARIKEFLPHDVTSFVVIAQMAYGWMPTIPRISIGHYNDTFWEDIENGSLDIDFLTALKAFCNNSVIGMSKVLHFLNPVQYAIWDRKNCIVLTGLTSHSTANKIFRYIEYCEDIRLIGANHDAELQIIKNHYINLNRCEQNTSLPRVIEMTLYYSAQ